ncbi:hypothetical protein [Weissella bombi]|uniref:HNH endonuclease n=2 Tax=Weissella bombi TaxID=1505725 RepID=A0A1C4A8V0_9LACO|nr:hypothetical protein [Weissella bombi]SCB90921.1 hypothetical protein GA0061074_10475 [Weissella bombi]
MQNIYEYLENLEKDQKDVLEWFYQKHDTLGSLPKSKRTDNGNLIVSPAMGIFKAKDNNFATSIKQTLKGPYQDSEIILDKNKIGIFLYHQQSTKNQGIFYDKDHLAANISLAQNMNKKIPVDVIIQQNGKKEGQNIYKFFIGMIFSWYDGFFIIQIANDKKLIDMNRSESEIKKILTFNNQNILGQEFDFKNIVDARKQQQRAIIIRQGQVSFRNKLLDIYDRTCSISKVNVESVLEAAHIFPYMGKETNISKNGLLL